MFTILLAVVGILHISVGISVDKPNDYTVCANHKRAVIFEKTCCLSSMDSAVYCELPKTTPLESSMQRVFSIAFIPVLGVRNNRSNGKWIARHSSD